MEIQERDEILEISCSEFSSKGLQKYIILALRVVTEQRKMADALAASRKRMEEELQIGREIQMSLLPDLSRMNLNSLFPPSVTLPLRLEATFTTIILSERTGFAFA